MNGRYLVTGGAGFIGSHLCEKLIEGGAEVLCVDNLLTGREENLRALLGSPKFQYRPQDIVRPFAVEGGLAGIFHLAAPSAPYVLLAIGVGLVSGAWHWPLLRFGALGRRV